MCLFCIKLCRVSWVGRVEGGLRSPAETESDKRQNAQSAASPRSGRVSPVCSLSCCDVCLCFGLALLTWITPTGLVLFTIIITAVVILTGYSLLLLAYNITSSKLRNNILFQFPLGLMS